jgi:hypothetical protein
MMIVTDSPAVQTADYLYHQYIMQATLRQVEQASEWYHNANMIARDISINMSISMEKAASILSAFSPRQRWDANVRLALAFSHGLPVRTLTNNIRMAEAAAVYGFDALKGQKTNAFARAIAGDTEAVVIDVWMIKAAGMDDSKGVNKTQYNMLADAVRNIASEHGLTPRTTQALIWIVKRGNHA